MEDIRQNIELNYSSNAETTAKEVEVLANSVDNVTDSQDKNSKSTKKNEESLSSFKTQLRQANQELLKASQIYGETSKEAVQAAKKVADLKDQMSFAKDLVDKFNPDQKMKALTAATSLAGTAMTGVTSGMALFGDQSEDTQKSLLKVQAAMAFGQAISGLSDVGDQFKVLKTTALDTFKGIKTAIGSTGIGLLVIALGAIYTYWDDIKEAVSGVSAEQRKLNEQSQKNVEQENEKLKTLGSQDNILKLQGKTEKEILAIKVKQTDEAIQATEINQKNQIQTNKLAVEGAKRNYEMLRSYIDFVSTPLRFLYKTGAEAINGIIGLLNKIPGVNIKGKLDEALGDKAADYITKLGFDPEKVKAEGDKSVKESADALTKLKNDRAGYKLAINEIGKKEVEDAKKKAEELAKIEDERRQKLLDELDAMNDFDQRVIENDAKKKAELKKQDDDAFAELEKDFDRKIELDKKLAEEQIAIEKAKQEQKQAIQDAEINLASSAIGFLNAISGKNKALQKAGIIAESALGIGKSIIQTTSANIAAVAQGAALSIPTAGASEINAARLVAMNNISLGFGTATNIAATAKALSALGGGSAPSSTTSTGGAPSTSASPQMSFQTSKENQIATSLSGKINEQPPIKTYMTSGDVATALLLHNKTIEENKI